MHSNITYAKHCIPTLCVASNPLENEQGYLKLFSFDSNPEPNPQNLHQGEANGPPKLIEWLGHLPGGGLRSSGMPHEGSVDHVSE